MKSVNLLPHGGEVFYYPGFFNKRTSDRCFSQLKETINWQQRSIRIFGRIIPQPRLIAWYADEGINYAYSGLKLQPDPWTAPLLKIKEDTETFTGGKFNGVLLNLYRNGKDSMGWHRDNEKEIEPRAIIASLSFGEERKFDFRVYGSRSHSLSLVLQHGSLLVMSGEVQRHWEHCLPKLRNECGERINVTFRSIMKPSYRY
jgi:alkylated DNA repair dioxygenase AlkB